MSPNSWGHLSECYITNKINAGWKFMIIQSTTNISDPNGILSTEFLEDMSPNSCGHLSECYFVCWRNAGWKYFACTGFPVM